jgi:MGT family glycosyltransferase
MIAAFTLPAMGHLKPMIPLIAELVARKQKVVCYGHRAFEDFIRSSGADFSPYPDIPYNFDSPDFNLVKMGANLILASEIIQAALLPGVRALAPRLILQDSMALWASRIGTALGIPRIQTIPTLVFNADTVRRMQKEDGIPKLTRDILCGMPLFLKAQISAGFSVSLQEAFGLERSWRHLKPPLCDLVFNITDLQTGPLQGDTPRHYIGSTFSTPSFTAPSAENSGYALITFGTLSNNQTERFEAAMRGASIAGLSVVAVCGRKVDLDHLKKIAGSLSTHHHGQTFAVVDRVADMEAAISSAKVVIHHAGMTTTWETIKYRKPALFIPTISDQMVLADRLEKFGLGVRLPKEDALDPQAIAAGIRKAAARPCRWEAVDTALKSAGGTKAGADIILAEMEKRR